MDEKELPLDARRGNDAGKRARRFLEAPAAGGGTFFFAAGFAFLDEALPKKLGSAPAGRFAAFFSAAASFSRLSAAAAAAAFSPVGSAQSSAAATPKASAGRRTWGRVRVSVDSSAYSSRN